MVHSKDKSALVLPLSVISKTDVARLQRETEALENFLHQASIRRPGSTVKLPRMSKLFDETVQANKLQVLGSEDRERLRQFLAVVNSSAPLLHMSFSADPSPLFLQKLITWLRTELHPLVLLHVGLQPGIGAGCVVRTKNKYFDFSLRQNFKDKRSILIDNLHVANMGGEKP